MDNRLSLTKFISADILQQLQDAFSDMTGIAALTADRDGTAVTKGSNFTELCFKYTRSSTIGKKRCEDCDRMGAELTMKKGRSCAYVCHAGLLDFASPIIANGEMIGSFIGGQVLVAPPDLERFGRVADELGIDRDEYIEAVKKVRIVNRDFVDKAVRCLSVIASVLSNIAYNGYMLHLSSVEAEKAAQAKSDFLANMSHEIRTPMNAVMGMAELALREEMSPAARNYIHQIKSSGKNLLVIINDILDYSKIESGKMDIIVVTYEPYSLFNDAASIVNSRIGSKNIEFTMDIPPDIPRKLMGDNVRIQQILVNLLNNAVKFTKNGNIHLKVEFEQTEEFTGILKASVTDTGSGIKPEDMEKLFKSFQQVDSKRNRNIEGTGLGLAISKRLLNLMGGSISVESEYEKGSVFSFELPQKIISSAAPIPKPAEPVTAALYVNSPYVKAQIKRDLERIGIPCTDIEETSTLDGSSFNYFIAERMLFTGRIKEFFLNSAAQCIVIDGFDSAYSIDDPSVRLVRKPVYFLNLYAAMDIISEYERDNSVNADDFSFTAPEARVLIVDDNTVNLAVAKGLIDPLDMHVDTACSAAETIEMIKEARYDLIFMDHMMPEVDGVETTRIIRRLMPSYADVPIIALTANVAEGTKEMFIREGMNDFVAKPIDTKEMISKLRKWLPQEKIIPAGKQPVSKETAAENSLLFNIKELNCKEAMSLLGSAELYRAVLKEYYSSIDKKSAAIEKHYHRKDWKNYTIEVHALKSTSRQIGADSLSELAAKLEKAGRIGDTALIDRKHGEMMGMYIYLKGILKPYFPEVKDEKIKTEADSFEIMQLLDELQNALDNFDTLLIDEVMEKMSEYTYDNVSTMFYEKLSAAAEESDIDVCIETVKNWKKDIAELYTNS